MADYTELENTICHETSNHVETLFAVWAREKIVAYLRGRTYGFARAYAGLIGAKAAAEEFYQMADEQVRHASAEETVAWIKSEPSKIDTSKRPFGLE